MRLDDFLYFFFNNDDRGNKTSGILFDIYVQHNL